MTPGKGSSFSGETVKTNAATESINDMSTPCWVRLVRMAGSFTAYYSKNGITWTQLGNAVTIKMTDPIFLGMAVTSHVHGKCCTAIFDNVHISNDVVGASVAGKPANDVAGAPVAGKPANDAAGAPVAGKPANDAAGAPVAGKPANDVAGSPVAGKPANDAASVPVAGKPATVQGAGQSNGAAPSGVDTVPTSGLLLWLNAGAITGVKNGGAVSIWPDSSRLGNNATQTTTGSQPTYDTGVLNGQPAVSFNSASSQYMHIASGFNGNQSTLTLFAVVHGDNAHSLLQTMPGQEGNLCFGTATDAIQHAIDIEVPIDVSKLPHGGLLTITCGRDTGGHIVITTYSNGVRYAGPTTGDTDPIYLYLGFVPGG